MIPLEAFPMQKNINAYRSGRSKLDRKLLYINCLSHRPSIKIYKDNQVTIKRALMEIIAPQTIPLDILITAIHELHIRKIF